MSTCRYFHVVIYMPWYGELASMRSTIYLNFLKVLGIDLLIESIEVVGLVNCLRPRHDYYFRCQLLTIINYPIRSSRSYLAAGRTICN